MLGDELDDLFSKEDDIPSNQEISDDELKVLELQRANRMRKKLAAKINSNNALEPVEIGKSVQKVHPTSLNETFCSLIKADIGIDLFPGEKEIIDNIFDAIKRGNVSLFKEEINKLSEILIAYKDDYHLELNEVLNRRFGDNCETLLHKTAALHKRGNFVW